MSDTDPCQSLKNQVADLKGQIKSLQDEIQSGGPKQGVGAQISKLNGELETAQAALEQCLTDHIACTVDGTAVPALADLDCQSAWKRDPASASKWDPGSGLCR